MSEQFVPLALPIPSVKDPAFAPFNLKVVPQSQASAPGFEPVAAHRPDPSGAADSCSQPTITVKRNGDVVSEIRIQCSCGKVIELTCLH